MTLKHTKNKLKNSGFTLIELIVTISIVSILVSIAVPSFSTMIQSNRVTTGTNEFISTLLLARSEALKRSNTVSVCITNNNQDDCKGVDETEFELGWLVFLDCNANGVLDTGGNQVCDNDGVADDSDQIIKIHGATEGLSIRVNTSGAGVKKGFITYSFTGRSDTRTFGIKPKNDSSDAKQITISRSGRVKSVSCADSSLPCS